MNGQTRWLLIAASCVSAFILLFTMNYKYIGSHSLISDLIRSRRADIRQFQTNSAQKQTLSSRNEINYARLLLADSVLSIIKNYYVDEERTGNEQLLESLLQYQKKNKALSVQTDGYQWMISHKKDDLTLEIPRRMPYDLLLHHILSFAHFLDNIDEPDQDDNIIGKIPEDSPGLLLTIKDLLSSLDAHSNLLSPEAYQELKQGTEGSFGGLGVLVGMRDDMLTVIKPLPSSPAEKVGIHQMDRILSINGLDTWGYSLSDLVEYMRGEPGSKVHLSLLRDGAQSVRKLNLRREIINVNSVNTSTIELPEGNILHITIESFTARTSDELKEALQQFNRSQSNTQTVGIILDMRSNPGGLLDQAISVADLFVENGVLVSTRGRMTESEHAHPIRYPWNESPMIVLLNNDSASASEIVAGALQDHNRATVIGQPSFGKGSVQTIFELPDNQALKLTIARYYTPSGQSIQNIGIQPDIWLQPLMKKNQNENLLGEYRYKNEGFLANHLQTPKKNIKKIEEKKQDRVKGYYLFETRSSEKSTISESQDTELNFSVKMMQAAAVAHSTKGSASLQRATYFRNLVSPTIIRETTKMSQSTKKYADQQFSLQWSENPTQKQADLEFYPELASLSTAHAGMVVELPVTIKNQSEFDAERISVFVRSPNPEIATSEELIGKIPARETWRGSVSFQIPPYWTGQSIPYETGLAFDAIAINSQTQSFRIQTPTIKRPDLKIEFSLVGEVGGKISGELEPRETAKLRLNIRNNSGIAARMLDIRLVNLAGKQLILMDKKKQVKYLAPFQKQQIHFALKASDTVIDSKMGLGLYIESKDLVLPVRKKADIHSVPGQTQEQHGRTYP
ncbi:MAG: PDZ domain-containing protein [Deltaproteobacteria bacterium]|nr:PDZ domain-containing protein [Deltaproteobacteria bacterium]